MTLKVTVTHANKGSAVAALVLQNGRPSMLTEGESMDFFVHPEAPLLVHEAEMPLDTLARIAELRAEVAQRAWAAYSVQAGGVSFDGKPLPSWEELGPNRQACWLAAVAAV